MPVPTFGRVYGLMLVARAIANRLHHTQIYSMLRKPIRQHSGQRIWPIHSEIVMMPSMPGMAIVPHRLAAAIEKPYCPHRKGHH